MEENNNVITKHCACMSSITQLT